ncbi:predicted protein [Coccidioides posadasii str. Silveira]|uniref:Predicted protein n=2 Tax=Coccidioides posadasii TaxID=199306 RepID=E9DHJ5_COCPS|nr:predicted protein [Coccidioides posadasii str. Silveira]KMM65846.1 hypothetical protein CPAG_02189 [Coccidioides posadasii RMSCC 3488]
MAIDGRERTFRRRTRRRKRSGRIGPLDKYERKVTQAASRGALKCLPRQRAAKSYTPLRSRFAPSSPCCDLSLGAVGGGEEASLQSGYNIEGSSLQAYPARPSGEAQKHMHKRGEMGLRQAPSN